MLTARPRASYTDESGKLTQTLTAPEDGLVLGASDSSVALPGRPVMAFGVLPAARAAEAPAEPEKAAQ